MRWSRNSRDQCFEAPRNEGLKPLYVFLFLSRMELVPLTDGSSTSLRLSLTMACTEHGRANTGHAAEISWPRQLEMSQSNCEECLPTMFNAKMPTLDLSARRAGSALWYIAVALKP